MEKFPRISPFILALSGALVLVALFPLADGGSLVIWKLAKAVYAAGVILFIFRI